MDSLKHIIYLITNLLNEMIYVGKHSTTTPYDMKSYWGSNTYLKDAIKKYGNKNFKRETLFVFETEEEAFAKEAEIVDKTFIEREDTYNFRTGGDGGYICSKETLEKMSQKRQDYWDGPEGKDAKKRMSQEQTGRIVSEETRNRMREWQLGEKGYWYGKFLSVKTRQKQSVAQMGPKNHNFGKRPSEETRERLKIASSGENNPFYGKQHTEASKKLMSLHSSLTFEEVEQRREDVKNEPKARGWRTKLGKKWGLGCSAVSAFINKYASDLMEK